MISRCSKFSFLNINLSTTKKKQLEYILNHIIFKTQDMFIEKGFTVKESKECGATGTMALLTMARYS